MKLRRIGDGYETLDGKFQIDRQENVTECQHPLCDQLHERFIEDGAHTVFYFLWIVWDVERRDYAGGHVVFDTKREAVEWLEKHLTLSETF